jgi:hypothetical protein
VFGPVGWMHTRRIDLPICMVHQAHLRRDGTPGLPYLPVSGTNVL